MLAATALGGAAGALVRYTTAVALATRLGTNWPATLAVNVTGSLAIGILAALAADGTMSPILKAALVTGFLGSLTTFSTYNLDTLYLLHENRPGAACLYSLGSLALGLLAAAGGWRLTHWLNQSHI